MLRSWAKDSETDPAPASQERAWTDRHKQQTREQSRRHSQRSPNARNVWPFGRRHQGCACKQHHEAERAHEKCPFFLQCGDYSRKRRKTWAPTSPQTSGPVSAPRMAVWPLLQRPHPICSCRLALGQQLFTYIFRKSNKTVFPTGFANWMLLFQIKKKKR